jgi:hypothetical protein
LVTFRIVARNNQEGCCDKHFTLKVSLTYLLRLEEEDEIHRPQSLINTLNGLILDSKFG